MGCMQKILRAAVKHRRFAPAIVAAMLMPLSACMVVGPDYVRPTVITPDAYKEIDGWRVAQPKDDLIRGAWWEIFGDPQLNALVAQVSVSNQNLAVAEAQYREAQALVREARASLLSDGDDRHRRQPIELIDYHRAGPASPRDCHFQLFIASRRIVGDRRLGSNSPHVWSPTRRALRRALQTWRARA